MGFLVVRIHSGVLERSTMKKFFRTIIDGLLWTAAIPGALLMWPFFASTAFINWVYDDDYEMETLGMLIGLMLTFAWGIGLFSLLAKINLAG